MESIIYKRSNTGAEQKFSIFISGETEQGKFCCTILKYDRIYKAVDLLLNENETYKSVMKKVQNLINLDDEMFNIIWESQRS